jgi:D-alanyl-lipoteichoic acid acyltransferase DltB (MBOAT superfamily)
MLFNSFAFLVFFPVVTVLFFLLPHKFRWQLLLAASCFFYMFFKPEYILILFGTIIIDYFAGLKIYASNSASTKKKWLIASIVANVGILAVFKYYNFLNGNITGLATAFGMTNPIPYLNIILPIGLSFHTFQAMSYTIEVYRGNQLPERHFGIYALYVMFYPQLVAGPIERPQNILWQFHKVQHFNYGDVVFGLKQMAWGMFKKVFIADRLAMIISDVFRHSENYHGIQILLAVFFFSVQIYCDFSGYSDIAIGAARVMGFKLMTNFNYPYFASGISEFWSRWHISLSTWFRDYLYIPLGGNRVSRMKVYRNLFIVFLLSGIWHGANWTFVIWGALHATFLLTEMMIRDYVSPRSSLVRKIRSIRPLTTFLTFTLVTLAWIFFRATSLRQALYLIAHSTDHLAGDIVRIITNKGTARYELLYLNQPVGAFLTAVAGIVILFVIEKLAKGKNVVRLISESKPVIRWSFYFLVIYITLFSITGNKIQFIYFQF